MTIAAFLSGTLVGGWVMALIFQRSFRDMLAELDRARRPMPTNRVAKYWRQP